MTALHLIYFVVLYKKERGVICKQKKLKEKL